MVKERHVLAEATARPKETESKGIWRVRLIEGDVHGSSGYYPASVLERDGAKAFPAGTHVYFDHPTWSEEFERPERSVRDLAGALLDDAVYEDGADGKGLFARVQFFPDHRDQIAAMAEHVGMSIRAIGVMDESPATGELIVQELVEGLSVDVVTHAGAGGKLVAMTESARRGTESTASAQLFELNEKDKQGLNRLFEAVTGLSERLSRMEEAAQKAREAKEEKAQESGLSVAEIIAKLDATDLPAASRKRLAEGYRPGDDFDQKIADEVAFVNEVRESMNTVKAPVKRSGGEDGPKGNIKESDGGDEDMIKSAFAELGWS